MLRPAHCDLCGTPMDPDVMHLLHDADCTRFLAGFCRCGDRWCCAECCTDSACVTPLAAAVREAHNQQVASMEDAS